MLIMVDNVDVALLRTQRDALLRLVKTVAPEYVEALDGLINLCDTMLDVAELEGE